MKKFIKGFLLSFSLIVVLAGCSKFVKVEKLLPNKSFDKVCTIYDENLGDNQYVDMAMGLEKGDDEIIINYAILMHGKDGEQIKITDDYDEEKALEEIKTAFTSEFDTDDAKAEIKDGYIRITFSTANTYYGNNVDAIVDDVKAEGFTCK